MGMTLREIGARAQALGLSIPEYLALQRQPKAEGEKLTPLQQMASYMGSQGKYGIRTRGGERTTTGDDPFMEWWEAQQAGGGGAGWRPETAAEAEALRAQAALYGAQTKDIPLGRELARRQTLAEVGATQAGLAANPRRIFEAIFHQARIKPTEMAKSLQEKITIPGFQGGGTVTGPGFTQPTRQRPRPRLSSLSRPTPSRPIGGLAEILAGLRGRGTATGPGFTPSKPVAGPVLSRVGKHDDEYALLAPGSVVAPKPTGEKPSMDNAISAILHQMRKGGIVSKPKAKKILKHGSVRGHELTERQEGLFGLIAGGGTPTRLRKAQGGLSTWGTEYGLPQSVIDELERLRVEGTGEILGATKAATGGTSLFDPLGGSTFEPGQASFLRGMNLRKYSKMSPTQMGALSAALSVNRVAPEDFEESLQRQFAGFNPVQAGTRAKFSGILGR